ncbi:MAG: hypothetical protein ACD_61C00301G0001 [uncultured bacterium]|nr:MAG: hypothetical protein ACD_61C00301G0001 [uncultured bacterium]
MQDEVKKNYDLVRILLFLLIIAVGSYVLGLIWAVLGRFTDIIVIVLVSWLVSFLLDPVVDLIQKYFRFSKIISTTVAYILLSVFIVTIGFVYIPLITTQILALVSLLPEYLGTVAPNILNSLNGPLISQIENSLTLIPSIAQFFFSAFIVLTLSFYFIIDKNKINREFFNLVPNSWHETMKFTEKVISDTFISFFRVQFFYGILIALITWLVMFLFGTGFAVSMAFFAGLFAIVPLIGPLLALALPVLVALLADPIKALFVGLILFIAQQIIFNVIGPKILGKAFSLHPAIILISLLIGLKFGGAFGAVFAIPVLGIGVVMIRTFGMRVARALSKSRSK